MPVEFMDIKTHCMLNQDINTSLDATLKGGDFCWRSEHNANDKQEPMTSSLETLLLGLEIVSNSIHVYDCILTNIRYYSLQWGRLNYRQ